MARASGVAGVASFIWRIALTTGTGSIFAFLVARAAYGSALLAPLFIVLSLSWGLAVFLPVQAALHAWNRSAPSPEPSCAGCAGCWALFVAGGLFLTFVQHLTGAYFARQVDFERFILLDGAPYPALFWLGYVGAGCLVPMLLAFHPGSSARARLLRHRCWSSSARLPGSTCSSSAARPGRWTSSRAMRRAAALPTARSAGTRRLHRNSCSDWAAWVLRSWSPSSASVFCNFLPRDDTMPRPGQRCAAR